MGSSELSRLDISTIVRAEEKRMQRQHLPTGESGIVEIPLFVFPQHNFPFFRRKIHGGEIAAEEVSLQRPLCVAFQKRWLKRSQTTSE